MAATKIKWSSLLNIAELEFVPEAPKILPVADELIQTIAWLTAATRHDRRLLRCDENGALLVGDAWSNLNVLESEALYPEPGTADSQDFVVANKGILIATSTEMVLIQFTRIEGGDYELIFVPPASLYWYPHPTFNVMASTVPAATGTASYVGAMSFG